MGALTASKSCHTCIGKGKNCMVRKQCIHCSTFKSLWMICQSCGTCKNQHYMLHDYLNICEPCFLNGFRNWCDDRRLKTLLKKDSFKFKIPY